MTKYFTNNFPVISLHKRPSTKSEVVTQMIYGESFLVSKKTKKWLKIKISEDNYKGYILNKNFINLLKPSHKINVLKAKIYKFPNKRKKINEITFGSKIKVISIKGKFFKFSKGWINKKEVKPISYKNKNPFSKITIFKNIKYKWGGSNYRGIDCSALVQIFYKYNNKFCPRDTKDQIKFFKESKNTKFFKKNDLIFWTGHVAVCINNKSLIHAYGPKKKVVIMNIKKTINEIKQNANLSVIGKMK